MSHAGGYARFPPLPLQEQGLSFWRQSLRDFSHPALAGFLIPVLKR